MSKVSLSPPGIFTAAVDALRDNRLLRVEVRRQREERELLDGVVEAVIEVAERALTLGVTVSPKLLLDVIDRASDER